jgi:hypothetical protein
MTKYRVYFYKDESDSTVVEAEDENDAVDKAMPYLQALKTDYYHGGDWVLDSVEEA